MGKREIVRNEQFLFFPQCFLLNQIIVSPFVHIFEIIYLFAAEFEEPKVGILGKGLCQIKERGGRSVDWFTSVCPFVTNIFRHIFSEAITNIHLTLGMVLLEGLQHVAYGPVTNNELRPDGEFFGRFSHNRPGAARRSSGCSSI